MPNDLQIYVDGINGDDGNGGTSWVDAYKTLAPGVVDWGTGVNNTLNVRNLNHSGLVTFPVGSSGNPNTLKGDGTFTITNPAGNGVSMLVDYGILDNVEIFNCSGNGIADNGAIGNQREILNCKIYNNTGRGVWGLSGLAWSKVSNTEIYNNGGSGYEVFSDLSEDWDDVLIYNNGVDGVSIRGNGDPVITLDNVDAYDNTGIGLKLDYDNVIMNSCSAYRNGTGVSLDNPITMSNTGLTFVYHNSTGLHVNGLSNILTLSKWIIAWNFLGIKAGNLAGNALTLSRCNLVGNTDALKPEFSGQNVPITIIDCIAAFNFNVINGINSVTFTGTVSYTLFDGNFNKIVNAPNFSEGSGNVDGAPQFNNASYEELDFRIPLASPAVGMSSTSGDVGAIDGALIGPTTAAEISGVPNADDQSVDITLDVMPAGASQVLLYRSRNNGAYTLAHTFTATGSWNDDNGGSGFNRYEVLFYIAVATGSPAGPPSICLTVQVGTDLKFSMGALLAAIETMINGDATLQGLGYKARTKFVDPAHLKRMVYILPGVELPQIRYATGLQETQLPVTLLVMNKSGHGRTAWDTNHVAVERILQLLDLNYKWGCNAYDTIVQTADHFAEGDGSQPQLPITRIDILAKSQYAKYIG